MQCPKCNHEGTMAEFGPDRQCPACQAYYDKAVRYAAGATSPEVSPPPKGPSITERLSAAGEAVAAGRERRAAAKARPAGSAAEPRHVRLSGVDIPFLSLVWLMTKLILAAIPAVILAMLILVMLYSFASGIREGLMKSSAFSAAPPASSANESSSPGFTEIAGQCQSISSFAETVMEARQGGAAMADMITTTDVAPLRSIIIDAYERSRYSTPDMRRRTIEDFKNEHYLECLKSAR